MGARVVNCFPTLPIAWSGDSVLQKIPEIRRLDNLIYRIIRLVIRIFTLGFVTFSINVAYERFRQQGGSQKQVEKLQGPLSSSTGANTQRTSVVEPSSNKKPQSYQSPVSNNEEPRVQSSRGALSSSSATDANTQGTVIVEHAPRGIDNTGNSCYANSLFQALATLYHKVIDYISAPQGQEEALANLQKVFRTIYDRTNPYDSDIRIEDFIRRLIDRSFGENNHEQQDVFAFHIFAFGTLFPFLAVPYTRMGFSGEVSQQQIQEYEKTRGEKKEGLPPRIPKKQDPVLSFIASLNSDHEGSHSLPELVRSLFIGYEKEWPTLPEHEIIYPPVIPLFIPRVSRPRDHKADPRFSRADPRSDVKRRCQVQISKEDVRVYDRWYKLCCMIFHQGLEAHSGHYTAAVRREDERGKEQWFLISDRNVTPIDFDTLKGPEYSEDLVFAGYAISTRVETQESREGASLSIAASSITVTASGSKTVITTSESEETPMEESLGNLPDAETSSSSRSE